MGFYSHVETQLLNRENCLPEAGTGGTIMGNTVLEETDNTCNNRKMKWTFPKFHLPRLCLTSILRDLVFLAIILWAYREGIFDQVPGIKSMLEICLNFASEIYGFFADLLIKIFSLLHLEVLWSFVRSLVR